MYMITYRCELEKQKDYEIHIEYPEEMAGFFRGGEDRPVSSLSD